MKIFGFTITREKKKPFKVYNNDCRYCPLFEQRNDEGEPIAGLCKELNQIVSNDMKCCTHKN